MNQFEEQLRENLRPQFEICYAKTKDPEEIFRVGYLCGMTRAAEIEAGSHPKRGVSTQERKEKP